MRIQTPYHLRTCEMFKQSPPAMKVFLGLVVLIQLSGCNNSEQVSFKSGGMTHTMAQGPNAIPKDFAELVYPEATTAGSVSAEGNNEEQSQFLMLSSASPVSSVSKWYQDQLKQQNWKVDKVQDMPKLVSISGHKDKVEVNVMIAEDGQKTTISLSTGSQVDGANEDKVPAENYTPDKLNPPTD